MSDFDKGGLIVGGTFRVRVETWECLIGAAGFCLRTDEGHDPWNALDHRPRFWVCKRYNEGDDQ